MTRGIRIETSRGNTDLIHRCQFNMVENIWDSESSLTWKEKVQFINHIMYSYWLKPGPKKIAIILFKCGLY